MQWELVKPWVNRVGIVLEFLSFWFAAPEILGEGRLRALEQRVEQGIRVLPWVALGVMGAVGMILQVVFALIAKSWSRRTANVACVVAMVATFWYCMRMATVVGKLRLKVVPSLLHVLADEESIRQRSLAVGAVLFVVGFLLQLIATF